MTELWNPSLKVGEMGSKQIDVSDVEEIYVEAEGYVYVQSTEP